MYKILDLFSGAGGLSLGFDLTNRFTTLAGIDNNAWAIKTFYKNHSQTPNKYSSPQDVCTLSGQDILDTLKINHIDVVVGGPPCQGFSVAGKRESEDERNKMVWEYFRLVKELTPSVFVMENVPGLLLAKHGGEKKLIDVLRKSFEDLGYRCALWKLNSADYGVPQVRKRAFLVGLMGDFKIEKPEPSTAESKNLFNYHLPIVTVEDAFGDLPKPIDEDPQDYTQPPTIEYQEFLREGSKALHNHTPSRHKPSMIERLRNQLPGTRLYPNWNHSWYKLKLDSPSPTVKQNNRAPFVHPTEPRVTSPRECARLQSFPDRYIFCGTKTAQLIQIGNAVPPLLARAIAEEVAIGLDRLQITTTESQIIQELVK